MNLNSIIKLFAPANRFPGWFCYLNISLVDLMLKKGWLWTAVRCDTGFTWNTLITESWNCSAIVMYPSRDPFVSPFEHSRCKTRRPSGLKCQIYVQCQSITSQWYRHPPPRHPPLTHLHSHSLVLAKNLGVCLRIFALAPLSRIQHATW